MKVHLKTLEDFFVLFCLFGWLVVVLEFLCVSCMSVLGFLLLLFRGFFFFFFLAYSGDALVIIEQ